MRENYMCNSDSKQVEQLLTSSVNVRDFSSSIFTYLNHRVSSVCPESLHPLALSLFNFAYLAAVRGLRERISEDSSVCLIDDGVSPEIFCAGVDKSKFMPPKRYSSLRYQDLLESRRNFDVLVVNASSILVKRLKGVAISPGWVTFETSATSFDDYRKNVRQKENLRKIRQLNYSYKVSVNLADLEYFYRAIYKPYIFARHDSNSVILPFWFLKRIFERGGLIFVTQNEKICAGSLFHVSGQSAISFATGVDCTLDATLTQSAQAACYYFFAKEMFARQCTRLSVGRSPALLGNGQFQYKRHWGYAAVVDSFHPRLVALRVKNSEIGRSFLEKNPLILQTRDGLVGVISVGEDNGGKRIEDLCSLYDTRGLKKLYVYIDPESKQRFTKYNNSRVQIVPRCDDWLLPNRAVSD